MEFWTAFTIGILGSFHCVGMCGPIAFALPLNRQSELSILGGSLLYNVGRLVTYFFIGVLFGLLGKSFVLVGFQQTLSIFVGIIMIATVLFPYFSSKKISFPTYTLWLGKVKGELGKRFNLKGNQSFQSAGTQRSFPILKDLNLFFIGILNGLLPCGLVYMAVAGAVAMATPLNGGVFMLIFGLGTIPFMFAVSFYGSKLKQKAIQPIRKLIPLFIILIGSLFVLRGMNLGIPYISPQLEAKKEIIKCH